LIYTVFMGDYLIKNALTLTETEEDVRDVLIHGETIAAIGTHIQAPPGCTLIEAEGKILVPGGIDVHTHMNLDVGFTVASDDFYTGTLAAAMGGTTTIVDHPGFGPKGCPLDYQIKKYHGLAQGKAVVDYGFHGVIQHVDDTVLSDMASLADQGITSFKIYLTYDYKIDDAGSFRVLERVQELGLLLAVHPENDGLVQLLRARCAAENHLSPEYHPRSRPVEAEAEAINRMILFAQRAGEAPLYIVHLTNALGLSFIQAARERGQKNVYAETCPQYLLLDETLYSKPDNEGLKYIICPPLRKKQDQEALWKGLSADIDTVATDHCPFFFLTQKMRGKDDFRLCPSGAPGVEERMALLFSEGVQKKRLSLRRFVELCSTNPAKLFGLYPRKGLIREGSDADLVIIDPNEVKTLSSARLHSHVDYSAYEGMKVHGYPQDVFLRGERIVQNGIFTGKAGQGSFIKREKPILTRGGES
jgi:dihydropyrimidinase